MSTEKINVTDIFSKLCLKIDTMLQNNVEVKKYMFGEAITFKIETEISLSIRKRSFEQYDLFINNSKCESLDIFRRRAIFMKLEEYIDNIESEKKKTQGYTLIEEFISQ